MARLDDDQRDLDGTEDEDTEQDTDAQEDDSSSDTEGDTERDSTESKGDAKRIADLQSKADKAEARANKAEKALAATSDDGKPVDPATVALMSELREASLDAVYGDYPELREFSINRDLIEGTTRVEMRGSAKALVSLIKSVSTKARNKALADSGISADPQDTKRRPPVDYTAMSDDDFTKELARLTGR